MLQDIRQSAHSTTAKVIVGLIILTFALFGVESIVGGIGGEPEVASVNGESIAERDFVNVLESKRRQIIAQMGDRADPDLIDEGLLRSSVLEGMIEEEVLRQDAENKGLYVSDFAVDDYIRNVEQFQVDGTFDNARMQMILRNAGLTLNAYRDSLRKQFVMRQPRAAIIASAFVLGDEQKEIIALESQTRSFGVVTVSKKDYLNSVAVGDDEVETYYSENKTDFKKPESVDVAYIEIRKQELIKGIEVSEDDARALYEEDRQGFVSDEQRHAAHILINIDESRTEEEALEVVNDLAARLEKGEDFAALATEFSEDEGSAENGGDLGMSGKGVYVSGFEDALYALELGQVSAPVKTEFGYHLIKLIDVESSDIAPFEEMKGELIARIQSDEADKIYLDLSERLADLSYSSPDLLEPSEELGLGIKELVGVSANTQDDIFSNVKVQRVLFDEDLIADQNNSELIEIDDGRAVVFRVNAYHEESVRPLTEVKENVRKILAAKKAEEYAATVGKELLARIEQGEDPAVISEEMGLSWTTHTDVRRDNTNVNRDLLVKVFASRLSDEPSDNVHGVEIEGGDFSVYRLDSVAQGDAGNMNDMEMRSISGMLGDTFGAEDYRAYQNVMIRDAEIEKI